MTDDLTPSAGVPWKTRISLVLPPAASGARKALHRVAGRGPASSGPQPAARSPQIALTHQQIAALARTSRETTTKVLRDFADRYLIRLTRGRITVLAPDRLADHAG
ncbi:winged helix-turn-helix domain-containing protein [Streptomyces spinoverrucosus]|uniref:helix-turn-helix domain-containing protein n=1 Tax=Streptomyces spinoverrucosus TaxID=284043 RepID=UPI0018C419EC|nr:helix-turn-helix domain-containing protein [Streptomyces spinoverrucosus]MBG0851516.1 winged helix-turn-helix domain-containing protein [Streptomyces spinoverrucosus]